MKLKAMGSAHEHVLEEGDDFGGRISEPIPNRVVFDRSNNWVVDTAGAGLTDAAAKVLVESGDFIDVTDMETVPYNEHQNIFLALGVEEAEAKAAAEAAEAEAAAAALAAAEDSESSDDGDDDDTETETPAARGRRR